MSEAEILQELRAIKESGFSLNSILAAMRDEIKTIHTEVGDIKKTLDSTNEKTIKNTEAISYLKSEVNENKSSCEKTCNIIFDKIREAKEETKTEVKNWIYGLTIMLLTSIIAWVVNIFF